MTMLKRSIANGDLPCLDAIPASLRDPSINNWAVATKKKVPVDLKHGAKPPMSVIGKNAVGEQHGTNETRFLPSARINDPDTWGQFERVRYMPCGDIFHNAGLVRPVATDGDYVAVPALALTEALNVRCFDIDRIKPHDELNAQRAKNKQRLLTDEEYQIASKAAWTVRGIIGKYIGGKTYTETSMSGNGLHLFVYDTLDHKNYYAPMAEMFASKQFIYMTGWKTPESHIELLYNDELVSALMAELLATGFLKEADQSLRGGVDAAQIMNTWDTSRGQDMNCTYETLTEWVYSSPIIREIYETQSTPPLRNGGGDTSWSQGTLTLIGHCEKKCPNPQMILDFVLNSPRLLGAGLTASGEDRYEKTARLFPRHIQKARASNAFVYDPTKASMIELGAEMLARISIGAMPTPTVTATTNQAAPAPVATNVVPLHEPVKAPPSPFSPAAIKIMQQLAGDWLSTSFYKTQPPPGLMGEWCACVAKSMYRPFDLVAIPAAFSALAGMTAQRWKFQNIGGTLHYLIAMKSGTGKSEGMNGCKRLISSIISDCASNEQGGIAYHPMKSIDVDSKQGLHIRLQENSCFCWSSEEGEKLIHRLQAGKDSQSAAFRGFILEAYDLSRDELEFHPSDSVNGGNRRDRILVNVSVSTCWVTTPPALIDHLTERYFELGFGQRQMLVYHPGSGGQPQPPENQLTRLPHGQLYSNMKDILYLAQALNASYSAMSIEYLAACKEAKAAQIPPPPIPPQRPLPGFMIHIDIEPEAQRLLTKVRASVDAFIDDINNEVTSHSGVYASFGRVVVNAQRHAQAMAVLENPMKPVITLHQMQWALGWCLQLEGRKVSAFDRGEFGDMLGRGVKGIVEHMKKFIAKYPKIFENGVAAFEFAEYCKARRPFKGPNASKDYLTALGECSQMYGLLEIDNLPPSGRGRPAQIIKPIPHRVWTE